MNKGTTRKIECVTTHMHEPCHTNETRSIRSKSKYLQRHIYIYIYINISMSISMSISVFIHTHRHEPRSIPSTNPSARRCRQSYTPRYLKSERDIKVHQFMKSRLRLHEALRNLEIFFSCPTGPFWRTSSNYTVLIRCICYGWLRLVGSLKLKDSFAKEP